MNNPAESNNNESTALSPLTGKRVSRRGLLGMAGQGILGIAALAIFQGNGAPAAAFAGLADGRTRLERMLPGAREIKNRAMAQPMSRSIAAFSDSASLPILLQQPYWGDPHFQNPENYLTIQAGRRLTPKTRQHADIDGDGQDELIGRNQDGTILVNQFDGTVTTPGSGSGQWRDLAAGPTLSNYSLWNDGFRRYGWEQPEYYQTIQTADIDGDRQAELIVRSRTGILAWKYRLNDSVPPQYVWAALPDGPQWHDAILTDFRTTAWDQPDRYMTIQCADIDGDGRDELLGRSGDPNPTSQTGDPGLQVWKFTSSNEWVQMQSLTTMSDVNGWNQPQYYETIQCADIDGDNIDEVIGRDSSGLHIWKYLPDEGGWTLCLTMTDFSDANGWNNPAYYTTIQTADIDGDGQAEIVARSANGMVVYRHSPVTRLMYLQSSLGDLADAHGWGVPEFYSTIQCADIDGDGKAEIIARAEGGIIAYEYGNGVWTLLPYGPNWSNNYPSVPSVDGVDWSQPQYYQTIQTAMVNTSAGKRAVLLGRSVTNVQTWQYTNGAGWDTTSIKYPQFLSDGVPGSDADQQATAYQYINENLSGTTKPVVDMRLRYADLSDTGTWVTNLTDNDGQGSLPKPDGVSKTNWNAVRGQLKWELGLLQNILTVKTHMHQWYTDQFINDAVTLPKVTTYLGLSPNTPGSGTNDINIANMAMSLFSGALSVALGVAGGETPLWATIATALLGSTSTALAFVPTDSSGDDLTKPLTMGYIKFTDALTSWFNNVLTAYDKNHIAITRDYGLLSVTGVTDIDWDSDDANKLLEQSRLSYEYSLWQAMVPFVWGTAQSLGFPGGYPQEYGYLNPVSGVTTWINDPAGHEGSWPSTDTLNELFTGLVEKPMPYEVMYGGEGWTQLNVYNWVPDVTLGDGLPPEVKLTITPALSRHPDTNQIIVRLIVTNDGAATLTDIQVTDIQLAGYPTLTTLPSTLFKLKHTQSGDYNLYFIDRIGTEGDPALLRLIGTYAGGPNGGGTFGGSFRVQIP